jgi:hypothetical protein
MALITTRNENMARRPRGPEKIQMDEKRFGYFPQRFTWRGQRYDVYAVERCWTVSRKRLGNRVDRLCFRVRCAPGAQTSQSGAGTFHLHQDLRTNTWRMEKIISQS